MNKPYLLIAGEDYYASPGVGDWMECFETREKAQNEVKLNTEQNSKYVICSYHCDWYHIVDLRDWTEK